MSDTTDTSLEPLAVLPRFLIAAVVVECAGFGIGIVRAQPGPDERAFQAAHDETVARTPSGLSLHIWPTTGSTHFALGDVITLDLEFGDQDGTRYDFDDTGYDRSGRLGIDRIHVAPEEHVEDPLHDHFHALGFGIVGGGLSSVPAPLTSPRVLSLDVNESVRFARPGSYLVYVESRRFLRREKLRERGVPLASNVLELTIGPRRTDLSSLADWPARALRYADTVEAAIELARRLLASSEAATEVGTDAFQLVLGLYGTTHRNVALDALRDGLAAAAGAVNEAVPRVAAFLDVMVTNPRTTSARHGGRPEPTAVVLERGREFECRLAWYRRQALAAGLRGTPQEAAQAAADFAAPEPEARCPAMQEQDVAGRRVLRGFLP